MKSEIIKLLRETEGYVSGQELCDRFAVSRTAVWKVINQLKEEGYQIEAVRNKGYHMIEDSEQDILNKQSIESHMETQVMGTQVIYYDEIDSTNNSAKIFAEQYAIENHRKQEQKVQEQQQETQRMGSRVHGTLVVADMQRAGKGRRGRVWESPAGTGIFMSLLLKPEFAPSKAPMLTLVMAQAVAKVLNDKQNLNKQIGINSGNHIDAKIKWPNDIVMNGRKVCGILTEMSAEIDYINYVVIGVGINANMEEFPEELSEMATSIKAVTGEKVIRAKLIADIIKAFEELYEQFCQTQYLSFMQEEYNKLLINRNEYVKVLEPGNTYEAYALGIDENGELLVRNEQDEMIKVYAGEVSVRGLYGYV